MINIAQKNNAPNVILICTDQWRGDCLGINGHPVVQTPWIDQLALDGARFNKAYSATPSCVPARAAIFTGQKQTTHGRVGYMDSIPWNYQNTIAEEFTKHGYQTQAIGKMHVYPERSQLGFQNVILHDGFLHNARARKKSYDLLDDYNHWLRERLGRDADYFENGINCNSWVARPWDKPEYTHPTNYITSEAIDFLRCRDPRKPFFLYLSYHRPHAPLDPPQWALDQYLNADMPPVPRGDWLKIFAPYQNSLRPDCSVGKISKQNLRRARAGYYGLMTQIDHQLNRLFETLQDYGQIQNTYICFTSDHGDLMGDHDLFRKCLPYEGSARVPMILKGPANSGIVRNSQHNQVVELRDIMPTLLDCANLPIPESVEGKSFLPIATGKTTQPLREYLHGEHIYFGHGVHWLTDGKEKYIWFSKDGIEQLFNLTNDPQECSDLASLPAYKERLLIWRKRLIKELKDREEKFVQNNKLIAGQQCRVCLSHLENSSRVMCKKISFKLK